MTEFRKYTAQTEYSGEPAAKLYANGKVRFNKIAGERWFDGAEHVEIFVSDDADEIGFAPAPATQEGTYAYTSDGQDSGTVAVRSVLTHYGIWHERMDESIAVPVRYDDDREMVVVDISEAAARWGRPSVGGGSSGG